MMKFFFVLVLSLSIARCFADEPEIQHGFPVFPPKPSGADLKLSPSKAYAGTTEALRECVRLVNESKKLGKAVLKEDDVKFVEIDTLHNPNPDNRAKLIFEAVDPRGKTTAFFYESGGKWYYTRSPSIGVAPHSKIARFSVPRPPLEISISYFVDTKTWKLDSVEETTNGTLRGGKQTNSHFYDNLSKNLGKPLEVVPSTREQSAAEARK